MLKDARTCTGCGACAYVCPYDALHMKADREGFFFPQIDKEKCVGCGLCEKVCLTAAELNPIRQAQICQAKDRELLREVSSGGAIRMISAAILRQGGAVAGVRYTPEIGGRWELVTEETGLAALSGSKYFQIPVPTACYGQVLAQLKSGRPVLCIGTPCQIDGFRRAIPGRLQEKLYTIDLVCGGTPSEKLEQTYIAYEQAREKKKVTIHEFRSKALGWKSSYTSLLKFSDGETRIVSGNENYYTRAFTSGRYLRHSCYNCSFCRRERTGDVTVGDAWGYTPERQIFPKPERGLSLVTANSEKGSALLELIREDAVTVPAPEAVLSRNKPLNRPTPEPRERACAYRLLDRLPFRLAIHLICWRYLVKRYLLRRKS